MPSRLSKVIFKTGKYKPFQSIVEKMQTVGVTLDHRVLNDCNFAVFDVESCARKVEEPYSLQLHFSNVQTPCNIVLSYQFADDPTIKTKIFWNSSDEEEEFKQKLEIGRASCRERV